MTVKTYSLSSSRVGWTVPLGVTSVTVDATGGSGGGAGSPISYTKGGRCVATLAVTPGTICYVRVGGNGQAAKSGTQQQLGGYNGGGNGTSGTSHYPGGAGGGGATDFRIGSDALTAQVVVAGGGGGYYGGTQYAGGNGTQSAGGAGGSNANYADTPGRKSGGAPYNANGKPGGRNTAGSPNNPLPVKAIDPAKEFPGVAPPPGGWQYYDNPPTASGGGNGYYGGGSGGDSEDAYGSGASGNGGNGSNYVSSGATAVTNTAATTLTNQTSYVQPVLSLTYSLPPNQPALAQPFNKSNQDNTASIQFSWQDAPVPESGDYITGAQIQYRNVGDTDWTLLATVTNNSGTYASAAGAFTPNTQIEWQVRSVGHLTANYGPWSSSFFFTAVNPPAPPTITIPATNQLVSASPVTVDWNNVSGQQEFEYTLSSGTGNTGTVYYDSGVQQGGTSAGTIQVNTTQATEYVNVRVMVNGLWSSYASVPINVQIVPPHVPSITAVGNNAAASITVSVANLPVSPNRTNVTQDPSMEKFTGSGADAYVATAADTTVKETGTQSVKITGGAAIVDGSGTYWYTLAPSANQRSDAANYIALPTSNGSCLLKVRLRLAASSVPVKVFLQVNWYGSASAVPGSSVTLTPGKWVDVPLFILGSTIPSSSLINGVSYGQLYLVGSSLATDTIMNLDSLDIESCTDAQVAAGDVTPFPYFDGRTAPPGGGYTVAWTGTADASSSTLVDGSVAVDHNDIYRSDPQHAEVRVAKNLPPNSSWTDTTPAHQVVYTYRAVAVTAAGAAVSS